MSLLRCAACDHRVWPSDSSCKGEDVPARLSAAADALEALDRPGTANALRDLAGRLNDQDGAVARAAVAAALGCAPRPAVPGEGAAVAQLRELLSGLGVDPQELTAAMVSAVRVAERWRAASLTWGPPVSTLREVFPELAAELDRLVRGWTA